ncbi:hypothetical protein DUI87_28451 [Hirundo rustica rustica]|uniref:Uncharacterized protein n=1 Tax=Hirundo rustica rustica TaxID=333673 RepID=A0A3M0J451_HIRRU|nr:hypothetical protein DUI87_28451 [Hirundo rustica rustica]
MRAGQRWAELLRVRAVVSISVGDTDNGIEGTLSKLDDTKLCDMLEGRDGIQRNLGRLESWLTYTGHGRDPQAPYDAQQHPFDPKQTLRAVGLVQDGGWTWYKPLAGLAPPNPR